jgi:hypothetical protein
VKRKRAGEAGRMDGQERREAEKELEIQEIK